MFNKSARSGGTCQALFYPVLTILWVLIVATLKVGTTMDIKNNYNFNITQLPSASQREDNDPSYPAGNYNQFLFRILSPECFSLVAKKFGKCIEVHRAMFNQK